MKTAVPAAHGRDPSARSLSHLQRQLAAWRRRQRKRSPLPEWLWEAAIEVARSQGVSRVSRLLRLDFYKLKRRLADARICPPAHTVPSGFVEVALCQPTAPKAECAVELADWQGRRLTLRCPAKPKVLVALARAFWEQEEP